MVMQESRHQRSESKGREESMKRKPFKSREALDNVILAAIKELSSTKKPFREISLDGGTSISIRVGQKRYLTARCAPKRKYFYIGHFYSEELDTYPGLTLPLPKNNPINYDDLIQIGNLLKKLKTRDLRNLIGTPQDPLTAQKIEEVLNHKKISSPKIPTKTDRPAPLQTSSTIDDEEFELEKQLIALDRKEVELKLAPLRKKKQS